MLNEAELIERESTIRVLRLDSSVLETKRSLARWLALALGIINPGESRQSAVWVVDALVYYQFIKQEEPSVEELIQYISSNWEPINEKTLRYHLSRMKKMGLLENSQGRFYFKQPSTGDKFDPQKVFEEIFSSAYKEAANRISLAIAELKNKSRLSSAEVNK